MTARTASITRTTGETNVTASVNLDGRGDAAISTGIGFLDHLLTSLSRHSRIDISLTCEGDLDVDDHHSAEDCALALGQAIDLALGERRGFARFGHAYAPLDEALARAVGDSVLIVPNIRGPLSMASQVALKWVRACASCRPILIQGLSIWGRRWRIFALNCAS